MENQNQNIQDKNDLFLFSTSLIFNNNINELLLFFGNLKNDIKVLEYIDNLKFIKGKDTWTIGNEFSFDWIGLTHLKIKCLSMKKNRNKIILIWKTKGDIGINFYRILCLYNISTSDQTLVKVIISKTERKNELIDAASSLKYYSNLIYNELISKSKYLQNIKEEIISYQSCIINKNYKEVWEFLLDLKKLSEITPIIGWHIEYNGPKLKVGTFIKYYFAPLNITAFMKVTDIKTPKKKNTWIYNLETIGAFISSLPKYIENKIIIINDNKTQLSVLHKFQSKISKDFIELFDLYKKECFNKYKQYIEENTNK